MRFKLVFPGGYKVEDIYDCDIDLNVVLENGDVYYGWFFTLKSIHNVMQRQDSKSFWVTDLIIVADLSYSTIRQTVKEHIDGGYLEKSMSLISCLSDGYGGYTSFDSIQQMEVVK